MFRTPAREAGDLASPEPEVQLAAVPDEPGPLEIPYAIRWLVPKGERFANFDILNDNDTQLDYYRRFGHVYAVGIPTKKWRLVVVSDPELLNEVAGDEEQFGKPIEEINFFGWFTWFQDHPTPSNFIEPLLTCRSFVPRSPDNLNVAEFCNRRIDAQIAHAAALQARDPAAAGELWSRIDHELVDRAPWVPLYNPRTVTVLGRRVGNYEYHPFWNVLLDQLWVR